jgi:hypothetical protein
VRLECGHGAPHILANRIDCAFVDPDPQLCQHY